MQTEFKWNTWRFGYEYDFLYHDRWLRRVHRRGAGHRRGAARCRARSTTSSRAPAGRFRRSAAWSASIPSGTRRSPPRFTGFKLPEINDYQGDFFDFDIYGTYSFTKNFGAQGGYRTLDASYHCEDMTTAS